MGMRFCRLLLAALLVSVFASGSVLASTMVVTSRGDTHVEGKTTLREAIAASTAGDTITFSLDGPVNLTNGEMTITHDLTIQGPAGRAQRILGGDGYNGSQRSRIFSITAGEVALANLSLEWGAATGAAATSATPATEGLGGAIYNTAHLRVTDCEFDFNAVSGGEGLAGTQDFPGAPAAAGKGGAIYNAGSLEASRCSFVSNGDGGGGQSNTAVGADGMGGAIYNAATAVVTNCTMFDNAARGNNPFPSPSKGGAGRGGAVYNAGSLVFKNNTVVQNYADGAPGVLGTGGIGGDGTGGGIFAAAGAQTQIGSSIISHNLARPGFGGTVGNQGVAQGPDVYGAVDSLGFNLIGTTQDSSGWQASDRIYGGDLLAERSPSNNGGATLTLPLRPGSPAIDQGASFGSATDERGLPRTYDDPGQPNRSGGDGTDVGAFELQPAAPSLLLNLSARAQCDPGDGALIGGFVITGDAPKTVIVRAIAPSSELDLNAALNDSMLELHSSDGRVIAENDNWADTQEAEFRAIRFGGGNAPHDAAILVTLNPGEYTAVVRGKNGTSGIALLEVYDLTSYSNSQLANLSARAFIGTDDRTTIDGVVLGGGGGGATTVLVRALGPSLKSYPLDYVPDPTLELHDEYGNLIASDDNWRDKQEAEIAATGLAPGNDLEAAIVADLQPGSYTAVARPRTASGIGLVEIYRLK